MKRIVHLTFDMRIGGAEEVIRNLVEHTDHAKYEVSVLCLEHQLGPLGRRLVSYGYEVTRLHRKPGFDTSLVNEVRRFILAKGTHVLHCHQYTPFVYGVLGATFTSTKVVFTEHGRFHPDMKNFKRILVNPFLCRLADCVTAISEATRDALVRFENIPRSWIDVVYNGIENSEGLGVRDLDFKRTLGIPEDVFVLGTVARLDSIKNHPMMIRGFRDVWERYPQAFLLIVGDGPERANLEYLAKGLQVDSNVLFTGFREDVQRFYNIMDVFLLTSFSEGTAMTLLEAMAGGLPCIATRVGGNPEIVLDEETGFLIPSGDEKGLTEKISLLIQDKDMRERMGEEGRSRFKEKFTVEKMVGAYEEIYEKVCRKC